MTNGNDGAYAFAIGGREMNGEDDYSQKGLTKIEYFAAMAMQGLIMNKVFVPEKEVAIESCKYADALINQLNKIK